MTGNGAIVYMCLYCVAMRHRESTLYTGERKPDGKCVKCTLIKFNHDSIIDPDTVDDESERARVGGMVIKLVECCNSINCK